MNLTRPEMEPIKFMSSAESDSSAGKDLLTVAYTRVQKESPEFLSVYEGINQSVDIGISTFIFRAAPEPVLSLYDFVMTTFVPQSNSEIAPQPEAQVDVAQLPSSEVNADDKIRVIVKLASVQSTCFISRNTFILSLTWDGSCSHSRTDEFSHPILIHGRRRSLGAPENSAGHWPARESCSEQ